MNRLEQHGLPAHPRYGCHECREDAELVMSGRAHPTVREQYGTHLRTCSDCRRMHRVLEALYEGPTVPAMRGLQQEREFQAILRRTKTDREEPRFQRMWARAGVFGLSAAAAVLALALFDQEVVVDTTHATASATSPAGTPLEEQPIDMGQMKVRGFDHPAQSYGRVVGGSASVIPPEAHPGSGSIFPVGTRFQLGLNESAQIALIGKIVANLTPGSEVLWSTATPSLLELELKRGLVAIRYDRELADPILQVRTPTHVVRVTGTVFTVQVDSEQRTVVSVLHGEVEVLDARTNEFLTQVEAGYRFDATRSTFGDVGRAEVAAALPLSNGSDDDGLDPASPSALADGTIPRSWTVPGLSLASDQRTLAHVSVGGNAAWEPMISLKAAPQQPNSEVAPVVITIPEDDGEDLIDHLMRDAERTRRKEVLASLERCRALYDTPSSRYLSARCLSAFIRKHGADPSAVEGHLLVGILRMDYALDYRAADASFREFLRRAPDHPRAELARYRLWLAATEDGRIHEAFSLGREYLELYRTGRYVGKVLQRFPELKAVL